MPLEGNKKSSRVPLTPDQIKEVIAFKKQKEFKQIEKLKKTKKYKILNVFNILCVIVYCEIIFCMYGPANYQTAICKKASVEEFGDIINGKRSVNFMSVWDQNNTHYKFYVGEYIQLPKPNSVFYVGKDYFLQKEIKVLISTSISEYRLWRVIPLVFLGIFVTLITMLVFAHNMNMINYSLIAVSCMNAINLLYFILV